MPDVARYLVARLHEWGRHTEPTGEINTCMVPSAPGTIHLAPGR